MRMWKRQTPRVKDQVLQAQSVGSELVRLHAAKMTACENVDASHLDATAAKATAFSSTLVRIEHEITKSLSTMRQKVAAERTASTRAKDDVNRYAVAAHEFSRLNLQTQGLRKSNSGHRINIRTAAASCNSNSDPAFVHGGRHAIEQGNLDHPIAARGPQAARERCG